MKQKGVEESWKNKHALKDLLFLGGHQMASTLIMK
jgi:hypothetical protein